MFIICKELGTRNTATNTATMAAIKSSNHGSIKPSNHNIVVLNNSGSRFRNNLPSNHDNNLLNNSGNKPRQQHMGIREEDHAKGVISHVFQDILSLLITTFIQNETHGAISKMYAEVHVKNQTLLRHNNLTSLTITLGTCAYP